MSSTTHILDSLTDVLESHRQEDNTVSFQIRQIAREKARLEAHLAKRKEENAMRVEKGLAPLPEEDLSRLFGGSSAGTAPPGRLDTTLLLGQADALGRALEIGSTKDLVALYASQA
jgi:translation initiation factor 3 subunit H